MCNLLVCDRKGRILPRIKVNTGKKGRPVLLRRTGCTRPLHMSETKGPVAGGIV